MRILCNCFLLLKIFPAIDLLPRQVIWCQVPFASLLFNYESKSNMKGFQDYSVTYLIIISFAITLQQNKKEGLMSHSPASHILCKHSRYILFLNCIDCSHRSTGPWNCPDPVGPPTTWSIVPRRDHCRPTCPDLDSMLYSAIKNKIETAHQ